MTSSCTLIEVEKILLIIFYDWKVICLFAITPSRCLSLDQSVTEIDIRSRGIFGGVCFSAETPDVTEPRPPIICSQSGQL